MRLVSFLSPESRKTCTGVVDGEEVVDLTAPPTGLPGDMTGLLALGEPAMERARTAARAAVSSGARRHPLDGLTLLAPVPVPPKILAIGLNYRPHVEEMGRDLPAHQYWFNKQRTCVTGPGSPIVVPSVSEQVDYEGELAVVVGRRAKSVPAGRWLEVVAGFTIVNDVSVRDWQSHSPTFTMGKSFDTHCPMGPWIVTPDELGDCGSLELRTWVDGDLRQQANTADLIFGPAEMVEYLTTVFPLEPGDVLSTGTPGGVGAGFRPPRWLRPGDTVRIEVEGIGTLENPVVSTDGAAGADRVAGGDGAAGSDRVAGGDGAAGAAQPARAGAGARQN